MSRSMIYSKTGCGTKSHITLRAKVAGALEFPSVGAHFASSLHSFPFVIGGNILREVPFNLPCNHGLSGRSPAFPSWGKVPNQFLGETNTEFLQRAACVVWWLLLQNEAVEDCSVKKIKQNPSPPFLPWYWNGVIGFHLIILVFTAHVLVVSNNNGWTGHLIYTAIFLFPVDLWELLRGSTCVSPSCKHRFCCRSS